MLLIARRPLGSVAATVRNHACLSNDSGPQAFTTQDAMCFLISTSCPLAPSSSVVYTNPHQAAFLIFTECILQYNCITEAKDLSDYCRVATGVQCTCIYRAEFDFRDQSHTHQRQHSDHLQIFVVCREALHDAMCCQL